LLSLARSFYHLPSTVIGNTVYPTLKAVYSFYNVATSMSLKVGQSFVLPSEGRSDAAWEERHGTAWVLLLRPDPLFLGMRRR
jgi:hypothetical protein